MNRLLQTPENWLCHFRVVCESQVFAGPQASLGILVCCFSPVKNVWNEWEAFLHQRECILWKGCERQGWARSMRCRMAGERGQGGTVTAWSRVGLKARESPQLDSANAPMQAPSSLEDMQGSDLEFRLKEGLGYTKFRWLGFMPSFCGLQHLGQHLCSQQWDPETLICQAELY